MAKLNGLVYVSSESSRLCNERQTFDRIHFTAGHFAKLEFEDETYLVVVVVVVLILGEPSTIWTLTTYKRAPFFIELFADVFSGGYRRR